MGLTITESAARGCVGSNGAAAQQQRARNRWLGGFGSKRESTSWDQFRTRGGEPTAEPVRGHARTPLTMMQKFVRRATFGWRPTSRRGRFREALIKYFKGQGNKSRNGRRTRHRDFSAGRSSHFHFGTAGFQDRRWTVSREEEKVRGFIQKPFANAGDHQFHRDIFSAQAQNPTR